MSASCAALLLAAPLIAQSQPTAQPKAAPAPAQKAPAAGCCAAPAQKPAATGQKPAAPAAPQKMARKGPPRGPIEKYDCKIGTEDQHARLALLAQGGEVQSVAYYSKWKPRTCSVHLQRGDAYSKWSDVGDATTITTEFGDFLIQVSRAEYQLFFRQVDRMHYCGMMGKLNGSMTVTRGPKRMCSIEGIMDKNEPEPADDKPPPIPTMTPPGPPLPPEALIPKPAESGSK
ncbi:MAG: hypothetical protein ABL891_07830 [Burkholderiales bacterium]